MTSQELEQKLLLLSKEEYRHFIALFYDYQKVEDESIERLLWEFSHHPEFEHRFCSLLGLKTESQKASDAALKSAHAARVSSLAAICSFIVGLIASVILGLNFYHLHYYRHDNVKATILYMFPYVLPNADKSAFSTDVVFVNEGNQQCSIVSLELEGEDLDRNVFQERVFALPLNEHSFTLKPNDVVSMHFKAREEELVTDFKNSKGADRVEFRLVFRIIDSTGQYHKKAQSIFKGVLEGTNGKLKPDLITLRDFPSTVQLLPSPNEKPTLIPKDAHFVHGSSH